MAVFVAPAMPVTHMIAVVPSTMESPNPLHPPLADLAAAPPQIAALLPHFQTQAWQWRDVAEQGRARIAVLQGLFPEEHV